MSWTRRHFVRRRRWDTRLLALGGAAMPFRHGITPIVAVVFGAIGLYLAIAKHRTARIFAFWFVTLAVSYAAWSLSLIVIRGDGLVGNRQVTYSLMIAILAFIGNGMVLVRDPLRSFVVGSRIGVMAAALVSLALDATGIYRFGMGGNPAPFAMIVAMAMIAAIIPLRKAPRFAPNSLLYLVAGAVPIFFSETRAVLVVVAFVLVAEGINWLAAKPRATRNRGLAAGALLLVAAVSVGPVNTMIEERFVPIFWYYAGYEEAWPESGTGDLRLAMWQGSVGAIAESPIIGLGTDRMDRVVANAPYLQEEIQVFAHAHNFVLDELLNHGVVGLVLLFGALGLGCAHVIRHNPQPAIRRNIVYAGLTVTSYGMLHNPFLHETTLSAVFLYLGVMIAYTTRRQMAARRRLKPAEPRSAGWVEYAPA